MVQQQQSYAFSLPNLQTQSSTFPFLASAHQVFTQEKSANPSLLQQKVSSQAENYSLERNQQNQFTRPTERTPPPAHRHAKSTDLPERMPEPGPRVPNPSNSFPPPSNHGGPIRAPTIPVRPHCPWCQQVAQWEHHARMAATQAKEMSDISKMAKYHAEKLRDHGCPPPPPKSPQ